MLNVRIIFLSRLIAILFISYLFTGCLYTVKNKFQNCAELGTCTSEEESNRFDIDDIDSRGEVDGLFYSIIFEAELIDLNGGTILQDAEGAAMSTDSGGDSGGPTVVTNIGSGSAAPTSTVDPVNVFNPDPINTTTECGFWKKVDLEYVPRDEFLAVSAVPGEIVFTQEALHIEEGYMPDWAEVLTITYSITLAYCNGALLPLADNAEWVSSMAVLSAPDEQGECLAYSQSTSPYTNPLTLNLDGQTNSGSGSSSGGGTYTNLDGDGYSSGSSSGSTSGGSSGGYTASGSMVVNPVDTGPNTTQPNVIEMPLSLLSYGGEGEGTETCVEISNGVEMTMSLIDVNDNLDNSSSTNSVNTY